MIIIKKTTNGQFIPKVVASNGEILLPTETYHNRKAGAINALRALKKILEAWDGQTVLDEKPPKEKKAKPEIDPSITTLEL